MVVDMRERERVAVMQIKNTFYFFYLVFFVAWRDLTGRFRAFTWLRRRDGILVEGGKGAC